MPVLATPWTSLEAIRLVVGILTPLSVVALGWFLNRRLHALQQTTWANQKLIEKRLALYDEIAPQLNRLYCYFAWVGEWKEISPPTVIAAKRALDKHVHVYRHILGEAFFTKYLAFTDALFMMFARPGKDALIRTTVTSQWGNRKLDSTYQWQADWDDDLADPEQALPREEIERRYLAVMETLRHGIVGPRD